jgi:intein/homing endonuclease
MAQVGGNHYETMAIAPWEIIKRNGLDFWEGNVLKYLLRYRKKNGLEDLMKARDYLDYLIERESSASDN